MKKKWERDYSALKQVLWMEARNIKFTAQAQMSLHERWSYALRRTDWQDGYVWCDCDSWKAAAKKLVQLYATIKLLISHNSVLCCVLKEWSETKHCVEQKQEMAASPLFETINN